MYLKSHSGCLLLPKNYGVLGGYWNWRESLNITIVEIGEGL